MNQEGCSRKIQKVKNFVSAGSLASLRNKQILKHKNKQNSGYVPHVQVLKSSEKHQKQKQNQKQSNYVPAGSHVLEQVQQVQQILPESTTHASQAAHEQVQQESQLPSTLANDKSEEPGLTTDKRKRGGTQMQKVHGRNERKLIVLNKLKQPIGPTKEVVTELGSFLGTLARNGAFCPLNVFSWNKLKAHDDVELYPGEIWHS